MEFRALIFIPLLSLTAMAQTPLPPSLAPVTSLPTSIGKKVLESCLKKDEGCKDLPVDVITTAASTPTQPSSCTIATPTPAPSAEGDEVQTTVILVSEMHGGKGKSGDWKSAYCYNWDQSSEFGLPKPGPDGDWSPKDLVKGVNDYAAHYWSSNDAESQEQYKQSLLIHGLGDYAKNGKPMSDSELGAHYAEAIREYTSDRETQLNILTRLSSYLYKAYNDKRNPLQNTNHDPIPTGTIPLQQLMKASFVSSPDQGGVCNDITQGLAVVAEKLFPKDDALVINSGSHYALMVSDKNKVHTVMSWSEKSTSTGEVTIDKDLPITNTRISKVVDGKLKELTVADTELGQVFKMVSAHGTKVIQTGYTPSIVTAEFKNGKKSYVAGIANTSNSQVLILVAQHQGKLLGMESFTQTGAAIQRVNGEANPMNFALSFQEVASKRIFNYVGPGVKISGTGGAQLDVSYGHGLSMNSVSSYIPSFSGNLQTFGKVDLATTPKNPKSPTFTANAEVDEFLGFKDIGAHGGAIANPGWAGISKMLSHSGLTLNQVNLSGGMQIPIQKNLSSQTNVNYQGTNIGQVVDITTGMNITSPQGVKVFAFVGYLNSDIKGYQTQNSLLQAPTGFQAGAKIQTPGGINFSTSVQGVGGPNHSLGNVTLGIPIKGKVKKKKPPIELPAPELPPVTPPEDGE